MMLKRGLILTILFGVFFYSCEKDDPIDDETKEEIFISEFIESVNTDSLESNVLWLQNMDSRFALADNRKEVATDILKKFKSFGYDNAYLDSFYLENYKTWQYNVIATLDGEINPDSICILGAHHDSFVYEPNPYELAPGANDNASGVSAVLEIARIMKKEKYKPNTTIRFISFAAEELNLYGSTDYAMKASKRGEKIKFMLNEDMIAYETSNDKSTWKVIILDYGNSHDLYLQTEELASTYTSLSTVNDNTYSNASDSYSFWIWGYKAIFFMCYGDDTNYHTINDLAEKCNFEYCSEITKLSCSVLLKNN